MKNPKVLPYERYNPQQSVISSGILDSSDCVVGSVKEIPAVSNIHSIPENLLQ